MAPLSSKCDDLVERFRRICTYMYAAGVVPVPVLPTVETKVEQRSSLLGCANTPDCCIDPEAVWCDCGNDCRSGDGYDDAVALKKLSNHLDKLEGPEKNNNRLFYLALPPQLFALSVRSIRKHCWAQKGRPHPRNP